MRRCCLTLLVVGLLIPNVSFAGAWNGAPSPHDSAHLVVVRPADFRAEDGKRIEPVKSPAACFDDTAVLVDRGLTATVHVRHAGEYRLWIRVKANLTKPSPLDVRLVQGTDTLVRGAANEGVGSVANGGPTGYEAYVKLAQQTGVTASSEKAANIDPDAADNEAAKLAAEIEDDLTAELDAEAGKKPGKNWIHDARVEELAADGPFYWWQTGKAKLAPGDYQLQIAPRQATAKKHAVVDAAFLSTSSEFVYPYAGDLDAPSASYVRFRIDELPQAGVPIGASLRLHYEPWGTPHVWLNPGKIQYEKAEPHVGRGYTRWYRLQDIKYAPAFGDSEVQLSLDFGDASLSKSIRGATQFAIYPHSDFVLREIDWHEPEGLRISFASDLKKHLHRLRTLRDYAREHYDFARQATKDKVFPLTRGELYFGNAWGGADGECVDYMVKTLRLLGFNCVGQSHDPIPYRKLYGWSSHAAVYSPEGAGLPFDEDDVRSKFDAHYKDYLAGQKELLAEVPIFQLADEPSEIDREAMSSPLWIFSKTPDGASYADESGNSDLNSRRCDLANCVLEGKIEQRGRSIGFCVAIDDPKRPTKYAFWRVGAISVDRTMNLSVGKVGIKSEEGAGVMNRPGASLPATPTDFKIVYEGNTAALYLGKRLIHQHIELPTKGGFGFTGGAKAILELRLRPIAKDEHILDATEVVIDQKKTDDVLKDLDSSELLDEISGEVADWAKLKPLERAVREDWVVAGGMPQAHEAFRRWAKEQGLEPSLFGVKSWDEVRMLTIRALVKTPEDARRFYYSRKFSGYLTPRMFALAAEAIRKHAPNPKMKSFVALSGHSLYFPSELPLDMFRLASETSAMMPGISDWMSLGSWRWDSHQAVAFSIAPYNAAARRYGQEPISFPMMHCVWPSDFRSYTMLANQVRYISFYNFGPGYAVTEGHWSEDPGSYEAVHNTTNRAAQVDDVLSSAQSRPARVAMLYSMSNEYWNPQSSFADKRSSFLALAHEYFQPELVTEEQIEADALQHYYALYVLDPRVKGQSQQKIAAWVKNGGLLWSCADSLTKNEFNEPLDLLADTVKIERTFADELAGAQPSAASELPVTFSPSKGETAFTPHTVALVGRASQIKPANDARVRGRYDNGEPAWIEASLGKGKVVYLGHRAGLTYVSKALILGGYHTVWADTGRASLTRPLHDAKIDRELVLSEPLLVATPMSNDAGTVIVLYNMQPGPVTNLQIDLKEPKSPHSVKLFDGHKLQDTPFQYEDGRVRLKLARSEGSQMIVVRRKPAEADDRPKQMRELASKELQSDDWRAVSAGAWFAGHLAQTESAKDLLPLLAHPRWEVRRAAAESLGRIGDSPSAEALIAALEKESDSHVVAEELAAAIQLRPSSAFDLCSKYSTYRDAYVRRQVLKGLASLLANEHSTTKASSKETRALANQLAQAGLDDPDLRVRGEAIRLLSACDAQAAVKRAIAVFTLEGTTSQEQGLLLDALAESDNAFDRWRQGNMPGGDAVLLGIAVRLTDPALAKALQTRWPRLNTNQLPLFIAAALRQRDPALARSLFAGRDRLPKDFQPYVPLILEQTFNQRYGNVLADWQAWLDKVSP